MLCREEDSPYFEIICKTQIIHVISVILQSEAMEIDYFYLKLESLWILINLAMVSEGGEKLMLVSELDKDLLLWDDKKMIEKDLQKNKSPLLYGINIIFQAELKNDAINQNKYWKDMLSHSLFFISNMITE